MDDTTIADIYRYAHEGELVGVALFRGLAAQREWAAGHVETLELAARLEEETRDMLEPRLAERGIGTVSAAEAERQAAEEYLPGILAGSWEEFCRSLVDWAGEAMDKFVSLARMVPDVERADVERLVQHEEALIACANASRRGDEGAACDYLRSHLEGTSPAASDVSSSEAEAP